MSTESALMTGHLKNGLLAAGGILIAILLSSCLQQPWRLLTGVTAR